MLTGSLRVAVDIGGTFTDLEILEESSGRHVAFKCPSTPADPSLGLMRGIAAAAERFDFSLAQVSTLMHGTTIATNAVLENRLPRTAVVTTRGFRDVLEIGRHVRRDVYASVAEPRRLLSRRADRYEARERVAADGSVDTPLDPAHARELAGRIAASGVEAVAVCFLHAYANPDHERLMAEALVDALGHRAVSVSHAVSPEIREYERTSTTVLNAALMPVVGDYLRRLRERMAAADFAPVLYLVQSNGGVASPELAAEQPARLLLSGPSGGALAARTLAGRLGLPDLVAVDMGGTSFDVSVIHRGAVRLITEGTVDGCPVRLPMVEINAIGAGGGSIAIAESGARLRVGPESAGADPGPAAYRAGGLEPTVTDANVALGRVDPDFFLGGEMRLDASAAREAIRERIAEPLGLDPTAAAEGIVRIAVSNMAAAIRLGLFEKGLDPRDFGIIAFGGAGGLHALEVAREVGARRVVFPRDAGTLSAYGMLFCDVAHDLARTRLMPADAAASEPLAALVGELAAEGQGRLEREGIAVADRASQCSLDLRYAGQAYEITVPLDGPEVTPQSLADTVARFHDLHEARYAHAERDAIPEVVTVRLTALGHLERPRTPEVEPGPAPAPKHRREAFLDDEWRAVPVYDRASFGAGAAISGPALVEEHYATIAVPGGWTVRCHPGGDLVAEAGQDPA